MANTVVKVPEATVEWGDCKIYRIPDDTAAIYYPGAMIGVNATGEGVKCDDTAGIRFDGILANTVRVQVFGDETAAQLLADQSRQLLVERPFRFTRKIAAASEATDIGKALYAKYDDEVSFTSSNSVFVGWVDDVLSATSVLVRPVWSGYSAGGVVGFDGATLTFTGATGANTIVVPDALADGLSIKEGSNAYITIVTSNSAERVLLSKNESFLDNVGVIFGTGEDILISWDNTRLNVTQGTVNSEIRWGVDGAGIDQRWYGDTASSYLLWDQSADQLILGGVATVSGLRVGTGGATAITTTRAVTKADSGGVFTVAQSSAYTITVATPGGAGERDLFQLVSPGANDVSIVATACTFEGSITIDAATIVATGSTLKFASGASLLGDNIELVSTSTSKFLVRAFASGAGGITIT